MRRIGLRLLVFGGIMSVLPLSILAIFGLQTARANLDDLLGYHHALSLSRTVSDVTEMLNQVERSLRVLATLESARLAGESANDQQQYLEETLARLPQVEYIAIIDETGRETVGVTKGKIRSRRPICMSALEAFVAQRPYLGSVYLTEQQEPVFNLSVPLLSQEQGKTSGGVSATVSMKTVLSQVHDSSGGEALRIFLVDGKGRLIGHLNYGAVSDVSASLPPGWSEGYRPPNSPPVTRTYQSYTGEQVIGAHAPVPETDWLVIAEQPVAEAYAPYRRVALTYGVSVGSLIFLVLSISLYFGLRFERELKAVEAGVRRVASGDLGHELPVQGDDELASVVRAVNQLSTELLTKREMEAAVRKADRQVAVGLLAAGVAHEVNTPLASVSILVEDLLERSRQGEVTTTEMEEALRLMRDEVTRCADTTRTLLDFARQTTPVEELVQVNDLLNATLALMRHQLRKQKIELNLALAPSLPPLILDKPGLQQVILNLVSNAIDAMPESGLLSVTTTATGERCLITIADSGTGIAPEDLERVFEPFFTKKPLGRGTGLGLPVCKEIIQRMDGELQIMSRPGAGTVVTITLPMQKELTHGGT